MIKTLIGGFSCVNTRLAFDTEILLDDNKIEKVLFDLNIDGKKQTKRMSTKILKMDDSNQYGHSMTKPLPYGCIKKQEHPPSLLEFNKILDRISQNDNIGHLFIVDNKFMIKPQKHCFLMNFIHLYSKKMEPFEWSTIQLMSIMRRNEEKDKTNSFSYTSKTHSTLKGKKFIPLYAEDLHFLIKKAGWFVTHIYEHYIFEQSKFKKDWS